MTKAEELRRAFRGEEKGRTWEDDGLEYTDLTAEDFEPDDVASAPLPQTRLRLNRVEGGRFMTGVVSAKSQGAPRKGWWN